MSWGYKILTVYLLFVAGIIYLVVRSASQTTDLVTTDYYEQELKYQDKLDAIKNANALSSPVRYSLNDHQLNISLPEEMKGNKVDAQIQLYCISDRKKDIIKKILTNDAGIHLPIPGNYQGMFEIKLSWVANKVDYYYEHKLFIQ